ncbi:MAG: DUF1343 domain-containing protein [Bryobacterales bacterium]|nr:DUF1343 domain-containing protein [Bryobacterales bacterium]
MSKRLVVLVCVLTVVLAAQSSYPGAADIDGAIEQAIQDDEIPGAVVRIGRPGQLLYEKAYGNRALTPAKEEMTADTVFDAASLTKVVATTSAMMKLFEQGRVRLNDPVTRYLKEFQDGKSEITVRQLLTHFSGLRPDVDLKPEWSGYETGIQKALVDKPVAAPGERFIYSDINFLLLGEMVRRLSGRPLNEYVEAEVFAPLGMKDTRFMPPRSWRPRVAPTEILAGSREPLRGLVHDPTTRFMGGVAGHAGLFTTARDLSRFAEMILNGGQRNGVRVFQPQTIRKFTEPQTPAYQSTLRGLGWDMDSRYSANRGELFPLGSFGHTGFTGTSLWLDPISKTYVILLANSVHPKLRPAITSLRGRVATLAALHAGYTTPGLALTSYNETMVGVQRASARNGKVLTGIDVLARENFARLRGKRVGLVTNHTGLARDGRRNLDLMVAAGVQLTALFSPEHGIAGKEDHENIGNSRDAQTGVPIYSLYQGANRRPSTEILKQLDVLVFDIQDIGARFYTYSCTLINTLEEAAKTGVPLMVLDRPNPITGVRVEGPMMDKDLESFVGCYSLPVRHGMTLGELATMVNAERALGAKLEVVKMEGWQRGDWFDSTGLRWVDPSPNMRTLTAALLYPGIALLEYSRNYSVGRGTQTPFQQIGSDWLNGVDLAQYLNARAIPGIRVYPSSFRPDASNLANQDLDGLRFVITDRNAFSPTHFGLELAAALVKLYPGRIDLQVNAKLIGSAKTIAALRDGVDPRTIVQNQQEELATFLDRRARHLLY